MDPLLLFVAHYDGLLRAVGLDECVEADEVLCIHPRCAFDFQGDLASAQYEVDFQACLGPPEVDGVVQFGIGPMGRQFHEDEVFEGLAKQLASLLIQVPVDKGSGHANVEEVELGCS